MSDINNKRKYKLMHNDTITFNGVRLYRIKALRDFSDVKAGDVGGFIEKESNLSHEGDCWVYDDAMVYGDARIIGNAKVRDNACIYGVVMITDNVEIAGNAIVEGQCITMYDNVKVYDNARICGNVRLYGNARVYGYAKIMNQAVIGGNARVHDYASVWNYARVYGNAEIYGNARIQECAEVCDNARVYGHAAIMGTARLHGNAEAYSTAVIRHGDLTKDIKDDIIQYIACSLNIYPVGGKYILYKRVDKMERTSDLDMEHLIRRIYQLDIPDEAYRSTTYTDGNLFYEPGKVTEAPRPNTCFHEGPDEFPEDGVEGIYCYMPFDENEIEGDALIAVEVDVKDILTCMKGRIRARRVRMIEEIKRR